MSKSYRPYGKSGTRQGHFILFYDEMLNSPAYRSLSCPAKCILITLKQCFNGYNNGEIALSCRTCASVHKMSKNTAQRALKELEEKGFIETMRPGFFGTRMATTYRLTMDANRGTRELPTNEWRQWGKTSQKTPGQSQNKASAMPTNDTEPTDHVPK